MSQLAKVLDGRIREWAKPETIVDFGTIQSDGSLLCDDFGPPIPTGEYQICRTLSIKNDYIDMKIRKGDRVLMVWIDSEPVVVDVLLEADDVL